MHVPEFSHSTMKGDAASQSSAWASRAIEAAHRRMTSWSFMSKEGGGILKEKRLVLKT